MPASPWVEAGRHRLLVRVVVLAFIVALLAEWLGPLTIPLGIGQVLLLPMVWALLLGLALGVWPARLPRGARIDLPAQLLSSAVLQPALLLIMAKLGLLVGSSLPELAEAGWGLLLQELGNLFGCVLVGLPVALLLGIKREAVGATFSMGREPSLAIIGEKYGMDSPEGRGVLAEYLTGTLLGAIFISILAGFVTSLGIFHPLALAMGAGMGSGSMTAAAVAAISVQQTPEVAEDVAAFAAASNLIASTLGTYLALFVSLPFASWAYRVLEPVLGRRGKPAAIDSCRSQAGMAAGDGLESSRAAVGLPVLPTVPVLGAAERIGIWLVSGAMVLAVNRIGFGVPLRDALPGVLWLLGAVLVGDLLYRTLRRKLPAICTVSLVAVLMSAPAMPFAATITELSGKVNFLALMTPSMAFAGLSLAKDLPGFRRLGWRIVVVSLLASTGVFLSATLIAQTFVHTM